MGAMKKMLMEGHELLDNLVAHAKANDVTLEPTGPNWMDELVNYLFNSHTDFAGLVRKDEPDFERWAHQIVIHWHRSKYGETA